ncbi:helix-turn-helix domain-containing protein, partial [Streptococcus pneumoniae]|uniref:helix-turn-helix domain-containing protein n=1 Tax=Streptococcus pneumoniae TaxID=1313 RepID=UPI000682CA20
MYRCLRDLREDHDLTQKQIAKILSFTNSAYAKIERGEHTLTADVLVTPNHSYLSQLDVTYKTPDLMSHFL